MKIDKPLVLKLENLARLRLSEEEREQMAVEMNQILGMVSKLEELDTEGVEPLKYLVDEPNGGRVDKIVQRISRKQALKNAPNQDGEFFKVPKVINL